MQSLKHPSFPDLGTSAFSRRAEAFRSVREARGRSRLCCVNQRNCSSDAPDATRRSALLAASGILLATSITVPTVSSAAEIRYIGIDQLSAFQRSGQRNLMLQRTTEELGKVLQPEDAPYAVKLVFNDAATYDVTTGTGGLNGSIIFDDELNRPENVPLKPIVAKLKQAKQAIDEGGAKIGQDPISWADLIVVAGKVATEMQWLDAKIKKSSTDADSAKFVAKQFGTQFPVSLGRLDASGPDPAARLPPSDAPVEDVKAFLLGLGSKAAGGPFAPKPLFWERPGFLVWTAAALDPAAEELRLADADATFAGIKKKYDASKRTVTRTDFEVDFIDYYTKLANLGAKFDSNAYLFPIAFEAKKL